jgi:hypothetical protein
MDHSPDTSADLLMLRGVVVLCADCGDETVFVPIDEDLSGPPSASTEYCCTSCDAAVFLFDDGARRRRRAAARVAS